MKKIDDFEFQCINGSCAGTVAFRLFEWEHKGTIECQACGKKYKLDESLRTHLRQFGNLVHAVREAKDIIGSINVGVNFHNHTMQIPYAILLTRLNPTLALSINGKEILFRFRVEPLDDEENQLETI